MPNPKGDGGGEGGGERSDSFMGGAFGDDDGPGFKGFAEADKEADFKTKYHNDGGRAVEMYDGHKAQLNMDPYYISRIKRHTYTLCEQDEKGGPKMQNPAPKGPDGVPVDKPERISIDGDGKFKKAMEKRERERTGNLGVRGWRFKSAKGDEKYEFDEDMWEKLKELGLATKKSSKDKDDKDEKDEEAKDDGGKALEDAQMADEELAEVQQNDAGSGAGAGAGDDKPPEKPADDDDEADDDKPEWELCIEEWGKSKKKLEENEEEYPQPGKGYRLIGKAYNRAQKWAIDQEKNRLRKEAERRIEAEKEAKRKKDAEVSAATNPSAADEGAGEEKEDENPVAVPLAPSGTGLLVPTPSGRRFKELQELDKADETRFIMCASRRAQKAQRAPSPRAPSRSRARARV